MNSHLFNDLGADQLDLIELMMVLEEEFEIEISDEDVQNRLDIEPEISFSCFSNAPSRDEGKIGAQAIVSNVVDVILENAPYLWKNNS